MPTTRHRRTRLVATCVVYSVITGCGWLIPSQSQPPKDDSVGIQENVQTDQDFHHEAGEVWAGETIRHLFVYRNDSTRHLRVASAQGIQTSCGCTHVRLDDEQLAPGTETRLALEVDTAGRIGPVSESATVTWQDSLGALHRCEFRLSADVASAFVFDPPEISFSKHDLRKGVRKTVRCRVNLPIDWKNVEVETQAAYLDVDMERIDGDDSEVVLTVGCEASHEGDSRKALIRLSVHSDAVSPGISHQGRLPVFSADLSNLRVAPRPLTLFPAGDRNIWQGYIILTGDVIASGVVLRGITGKHGKVTFETTPLGAAAQRVDLRLVGSLDTVARDKRHLLLTFDNGVQHSTRFRLGDSAQVSNDPQDRR